MNRSACTRSLAALAVGALLWLMTVSANDHNEAVRALRQRRSELHLQLVSERARILHTDPEAQAMRRRIEHLYRELDGLVTARPIIQQLQRDLQQVEEALDRAAPSGDDAGRAQNRD